MAEQHSALSEQHIKVREVTHHQFSWTETRPGEPGTFSVQLVLDQGAEEAIIRPTSDDADALHDMFESGEKIYFDMERRVLMFGVKAAG